MSRFWFHSYPDVRKTTEDPVYKGTERSKTSTDVKNRTPEKKVEVSRSKVGDESRRVEGKTENGREIFLGPLV